jgi:hypothetical protein
MHALRDFFTTDYGLMSAAGILFMLGMLGYYVYYFIHHMHVDEKAEQDRLAAAAQVS